MRILITGGAGFIGANLAKHFNIKEWDVAVMDNLIRRGSEFNLPYFKMSGIKFIHGDIRCKEDFNKLEGKYDVILETAAQPSACTGYSNPEFDMTNNHFGLLNVLEYARKNGSKMIFWSTNKVYSGEKINAIPVKERKTRFTSNQYIDENFSIDGGDHSIYGVSKACADITCQEWAKAFDMNIIINRFSCLSGSGQFGITEQGWLTWFIIAAHFNLPITIFGFKGKQVRDVLFMPDIINLIEKQIENIHKFKGEVFNVGGGKEVNTSLIECISLIEKITNKKLKVTYNPKKRTSDQCVYISDISKVKKAFKWNPEINLEEGINQIFSWVKREERLEQLYP